MSIPAKIGTESPDLLAPEPVASSSKQPLCGSCNLLPAKYTCPGCHIRTCSLPCSKRHKENTGCTGKRNKAVYVPMNEYTYGKMVDDYVYLEEVGRKVGEWGNEIVKGGFMNPSTAGTGIGAGRGGMRGGMRGRGRGRGALHGQSKRDFMKQEFEMKDIDVDLLPQGMERRKLNQSTWDPKKHSGLLTIEFKIYKPKDSFAPSSKSLDPPYTLLTHRNSTEKGLLDVLRERLIELGSKGKKPSSVAYPEWVRRLLFPTEEDPEAFTKPHFIIPTRLENLSSPNHLGRLQKPKLAYHALDPLQPLTTALRHTHFVEYPTIEVWEELDKTIVDKEGIVQQEEEVQRPLKRRKMSAKAGKKAIVGLIGGYGSSEDEEGGQDEYANEEHVGSGKVEETTNGLVALGDYSGSEDDSDQEIEPGALLELMRKAQAGGNSSWAAAKEEEDEAVDWGDVDDEGQDDQEGSTEE